jgi:hypothetical protein
LVPLLGSFLVLSIWGAPGCKPEKKELTPAQRCRQGCEYRVQCIEQMALQKAVTEANRRHLRKTQKKSHDRFVDFCYRSCMAGKARFRAFARCGVTAKSCDEYFECESQKTRAPKAPRPRTARPRADKP